MMANTSKIVQLTQALNCRMVLTKYANLASSPLSLLTALTMWLSRQEKHVMSGFPKLPLYIRYFTCEGKDGRIKFYDDIYEEDRYLREKYFADKSVQ